MIQQLNFTDFSSVVEKKFNKISSDENNILVQMRTNKDTLWNLYLNSFPSEVNPIFRERTEYECNCCKNFICKLGSLAYINVNKNTIHTLWENLNVPSYFADVANKLDEYVKSCSIENYYYTSENIAGSLSNKDSIDPSITWNHFYAKVPSKFVKDNNEIGSLLSSKNGDYSVLKRSMEELTLDSAETVLDLINQNSLYGGASHKEQVKAFIKCKKEYDNSSDKNLFLWTKAYQLGHTGRFKNTIIGTLLEDLSANDADINKAVSSFETKHAPQNYRRTTAVITPKMIQMAQDKIKSLGYEDSIYRRLATVNDISVNDVLFTSVHEKPLNVFDSMMNDSNKKQSSKSLDKIETVDLQKFITDVLPTCNKVEILFDHKLKSNLMTLVASQHETSKQLFQWDNNISWSYKGDVTDSIKERVKSAGGSVEGDLRVSLAWSNSSDLDLYCIEPNKNMIYFGNKLSSNGNGKLDVDANGGRVTNSTDPVENIIFKTKNNMQNGKYIFGVHQFNHRSSSNVGYEIQVEYDGIIQTFNFEKDTRHDKKINCIEITLKDGQFTLKKVFDELTCTSSSTIKEEVWGITTNEFVPVNMVMLSPNHWENNAKKVGHKHTFFILEGCNTDEDIRGFYNEYLSSDLNEHRKVLEVLGSKLKIKAESSSLSGFGFSETVKTEFIVRAHGKFQRTLKVTI
jgi:hypothetical protein